LFDDVVHLEGFGFPCLGDGFEKPRNRLGTFVGSSPG
jgi:hypothetical protein